VGVFYLSNAGSVTRLYLLPRIHDPLTLRAMWILYDFETSSRELIGQITSYAFWVVNDQWEPIKRLIGKVKLRPTEMPELDAILVTQLQISQLQSEGLSEYAASLRIYQFLSDCILEYGHCILAGYNSSQFDLKFLRTTLIRNGFNPYFMGKLSSIDVLHFIHDVAIQSGDNFPWTTDGDYWTFSLESVSRKHGILLGSQRHDAEADVILMRDLIRCIENRYSRHIRDFRPVRLPHNARCEPEYTLFRQLTRGTPPQKIKDRIWYRLFHSKSDIIVIDPTQLDPTDTTTLTDLLPHIRYINCNTHAFITEPLAIAEQRQWASIIGLINETVSAIGLTRERYFDAIKKPWDIEYRIHEMGFERIDTLSAFITTFNADATAYPAEISKYWEHHSDEKDRFLIQLANRFALNNIPGIPVSLSDRYIVPRYIELSMYRDKETTESFLTQLDRAKHMTPTGESVKVVNDYIAYAAAFIDRYEIGRFING